MTLDEIKTGFQVTENQLIEKLAQVQALANNNQIRIIELLLAEVVFMEQHYMSSFHRGRKLDLTNLPRFLEEHSKRNYQPTRKRSRKKRPSKNRTS